MRGTAGRNLPRPCLTRARVGAPIGRQAGPAVPRRSFHLRVGGSPSPFVVAELAPIIREFRRLLQRDQRSTRQNKFCIAAPADCEMLAMIHHRLWLAFASSMRSLHVASMSRGAAVGACKLLKFLGWTCDIQSSPESERIKNCIG
jgi:hypothetical protein